METKTFKLSIPFAEKTARKNAKSLGAIWNAEEKVWVVTSTEYKVKNIKNLGFYIVSESTANTVDSGAGFAMENTAYNRKMVSEFGFDAIEKI